MRNHTLMQTIARANRVFRDKVSGLIVDYVGVFRNMQKALAIYGSGVSGAAGAGECPVQIKAFLVEKLREKLAESEVFLQKLGNPLNAIQAARDFDYIARRDAAVEAILVSEAAKKQYLGLANQVARLYKAILPDPVVNEFGPKRAILVNLAEAIRSLDPEVEISGIMEQVEGLLDESIAAEGYIIHEPGAAGFGGPLDISTIDFVALKEQFAKGKKRTELERLRAALEQKLKTLTLLNRSRMNYLERFQRLIDDYNRGARNVEASFDELLSFAQDLNAEERRHLQEELSEEELSLFDLLIKPAPGMSDKERKQVKKVAKDLLGLLREKLVLDWRKKEMTRAGVRQTIEIKLDELPDVFNKGIYQQKCDAVYQHVYDSYYGSGRSVFELGQ